MAERGSDDTRVEDPPRDGLALIPDADGSLRTEILQTPGTLHRPPENEAGVNVVTVNRSGTEQQPAGGREDASMDSTASGGSDSNLEEHRVDASEGKETGGGETRPSPAADLDEMMDIGTVDQREQEAQMGGGDESSATAAALEAEPDVKPGTAPTSEAATGVGSDHSAPAAATNGVEVVKLSVQKSDGEKAVGTSPSPPLVKVKDEPLDEEYEQALISSAATASVKDEPNVAKEDLRIGSVYSVPPAPDTPRLPVVRAPPLQMFCFNCKKGLVKGQTAYQRKGSPMLFCSTTCLTSAFITSKGNSNICFNCQAAILRPQDVILAPCPKGTMREFCSQLCLTSFNYKNSQECAAAKQATPALLQLQSICSMCSRLRASKHEVILGGNAHKICSDSCFDHFRTVNNLTMAGCASCGAFYTGKPLVLKLNGATKTLCNTGCLAKLKENTKTMVSCVMCHTSRSIAEMVDNKNPDESISLFCSSSCVMAFMVQTVSSSGARLNCDSCSKNMVPAYHLAMSDTTIRNFCTLPCVMAFQEKFKKSPKQLNVFTKLPSGSNHIHILPQPPRQDASKAQPRLDCCQCKCEITSKPELVQIKDKLALVCNKDCAQEFKRINNILAVCEYCKVEKVSRDTKRINSKDCYFCSDGCALLHRRELAQSWGRHCSSCAYCQCVSKRLVTAQYGGSLEDFCTEDCRSKYTMLFCHVATCDTCGQKGKLKESLPVLGEVQHFCDMKCLLQFCGEKATVVAAVPEAELYRAGEEPTPVIANVVSLAGATPAKPSGTESEQKAGKQSDAETAAPNNTKTPTQSSPTLQTSSTQTDPHTVKVPPPPPPKVLKNKALLCRPLVQNKGVSCKTQTVDVEAQTDETTPQLLVVPIPVPVYVPVPMNMYSQMTPKPVSLPLPLPVPMFLPVTMDSAERIVETIEEIKEKIPSDPFEAELILMAEMVAEQAQTSDKDEEAKDKGADNKTDRGHIALDDRASSYSDDLDTDELASFLNTFDDPSSDSAVRSPGRPYADDKLNPTLDVRVATPTALELPPPAPPSMDIEADFTVEILERMARLREQPRQPPSPSPSASRRRQAHRKARDKRGRKSQRSKKAAPEDPSSVPAKAGVLAEVPKLRSEYGVEAWRRWIQWRQTQPHLENPRLGSRPMELKEDLLRCSTAELSYGLCCFITEVKRPNGENYSPDSLFYLCLGIQQYLFESGRVENIFMDHFYNKFSTEITRLLRDFKPSTTASGYIHSRVEEEYLWECKQLGAYSPIVLLNTLLFFCCKFFGFTTVEQHRQLSFAHVMRCTKTNHNSKTTFLRFYPPLSMNESEPDAEVPAKKRKEEESKEEVLEMMENTDNPLRCPVRLYEFYLSKCSESVKQRTNLFYLHPERCCVPNSPLWFSSTPLDDATMEAMLTRILAVRELHLMAKRGGREQGRHEDPPFLPGEDDEESE